MKKLVPLFLLLVPVAVVCGAWALGAAQPREHSATVRAVIDASPLEVYAAIVDVAGGATWRPDVESVDVLSGPDEPLRWREHGSFGAVTFVQTGASPPRTFQASIAGEDQPFGGSWTYVVEPTTGAEAAVVTITEEGWIDSAIFRFLAHYVGGHHATLEGYLEALAAHTGSLRSIERVGPE